MSDFVVIHGAGGGGFRWQMVADLLRGKGHRVWTPTLTGLGERRHLLTPEVGLDTHIRDIEAVLFYEDLRDAVLVAHSYGGMVAAGLDEDAAARVGTVVLLDAALPRDGESIHEMYASAGDGQLSPELLALHRQPERDPDRVVLELPGQRDDPRMSPLLLSTHWDPVRLGPLFASSRPRFYIRCTAPQTVHSVSAERAAHDGWTMWEVPAPHGAMVTHPDLVAERLETAASPPG